MTRKSTAERKTEEWQLPCPHCGEIVSLIGSVVIEDEFKLGPAAVKSRRDAGTFPEPVLDLTNRLLWLRSDVEAAIAKETQGKVVEFVQEIEDLIERLPPDQREKARQLLADELENGGTGN